MQTTRSTENEGGIDTSLATMPMVHGTLPRWVPWAVFAGVATVAGAVFAAIGFNIALFAVGVVVLSAVVLYGWSRAVEGARRALDRVVTIVVTSAFLIAVIPLVSVLLTTVSRGLEALDVELLTFSMRGVVGAGGGIYHAIVGTLVVTAVTAIMAVPVGVLAGIYLVEYGGRGRLATALTFFVDVMVGIPSIVAGLFTVAMFTIFLGSGVRLGIMGAVALFVLMVPIVVRSTEEMLKIVPDDLREASYALGVPKWRTVAKVVLPTALAGIAAGVTLAVARVIGETAPLLITLGITSSTNFNPFDGRMATLPVFAYEEYKNPGVPNDPYLDRAWAAALVLIIIVMVLNLVARLISKKFSPKIRG
ncbi:MAG: phosphate ABC transporter permease PstA [Pseudonocardiaceae bacterium]|nr:phosphate ABC transporter permease PstA [Pseudonocardiaceae bacterium]